MSVGIDKLASELQKVIEEKDKNKKTPYDTEAEVVRVDIDTVWVKIPGGVDETPVQKTVNAKVGDIVQVRVSGGRAFLVGNGTNPPTDDTRANEASYQAQNAEVHAVNAEGAAADAMKSAENARIDASIAHQMAENATDSAEEANRQAQNANSYATSALDQLGVVEDVVGILNWASEHGSYILTSDTEIVEGKVYFVYDSVSGDYSPVVNPVASELSSYYELTVNEAMNDFIMSHLAVTSRGLWVLPNGINSGSVTPETGETETDARARLGNNYKVLLSNDSMYVYDGSGQIIARYGSTATIGSSNGSHFVINTDSIQAFDNNNVKYFEVNPNSMQYGNKVAASTDDINALSDDISDAAKKATSFITKLDDNGIRIHPSATEDNAIVLNANGVEIFKGGNATENSVAFYGEAARIGAKVKNSSYIELRPSKMTLYGTNVYNHEGQLYCVGNLYNEAVTDTFSGDGTTKQYPLSSITSLSQPSDLVVSVDDVVKTYSTDYSVTYDYSNWAVVVKFTTAPAQGSVIKIEYSCPEPVPYMTVGSRLYPGTVRPFSMTFGASNTATAWYSYVFGYYSAATALYSFACGHHTQATGKCSKAEGKDTKAKGIASHAEGYTTQATGDYSHAEGEGVVASGVGSHAEGYGYYSSNTRYGEASGEYSHIEGYCGTASGQYSHVEGYYTTSSGSASHAEGYYSIAKGNYSHAEGQGRAHGNKSHAEGASTYAYGDYSHAEGESTHTGNSNNSSLGRAAHAEGYSTTASANYAHSEGHSTSAEGLCSHSEGENSHAYGNYSHASGYYSDANGYCQTVIGTANVAQGSAASKSTSDNAFIIGNGVFTRRANALAVTWAGNMTIAGRLTQSSDRRLKDHISYLDTDADDFIRGLKPAHYVKDDEHHVGFYAQDVEKVDKWNCMTGEMNGFKTLGYEELIAPLVAYCQHLEQRIEELEKGR